MTSKIKEWTHVTKDLFENEILPENQRKIWRKVFDHYVFQLDGKPAAHLPDDLQDIVTHLSDEQRQKLRSLLGQGLLN